MGAVNEALSGQLVQSTSIKSNVGHLEASAAAAGLVPLALMALGMSLMSANAQLKRCIHCLPLSSKFVGSRLNMHIFAIIKLVPQYFELPVSLTARATGYSWPGRLSSFGFSGTVAHATFLPYVLQNSNNVTISKSHYRMELWRPLYQYVSDPSPQETEECQTDTAKHVL